MRLPPVLKAVLVAAVMLCVAAGAQPVPAATPLVKADQQILADMAGGNLAEIEWGKLADTKSRNDQVKTFARQMIDDHTRALTDITQFATARSAPLPTAVDAAGKAVAGKLAALSGDAFDQAYMKEAGVAAHKKMHALLAASHRKARDPELKALALRLQPTVEQHLKAAQQMKKGDSRPDKMPAATAAGH
jgi:putative membrane protein